MAPSAMHSLDPSQLVAFTNAAAGHDGVLSDSSGELLIKPCVDAELAFYQETLAKHPDFAELMPTFLGTLSLGPPQVPSKEVEITQEQKDEPRLHGVKIASSTAIVLENLEHKFLAPNVLDVKLGSLLYNPATTPAEKAARLDKVSQETTSSSLHFRIAGMKVYTPATKSHKIYDKSYGRELTAQTIPSAFETFFAPLFSPEIRPEHAVLLLETILAEVTKARHILERLQSRMYSTSVLIVYEGDPAALNQLLGGGESKTPRIAETAPRLGELKMAEAEDGEEGDDAEPVAFRVKMIDFAHAEWGVDGGRDENVITGLRNVEGVLDGLVGKFD